MGHLNTTYEVLLLTLAPTPIEPVSDQAPNPIYKKYQEFI